MEKSIEVWLFADDCLIYTSVFSVKDQILHNVSSAKIQDWCHEWDIEINIKKYLKKISPFVFIFIGWDKLFTTFGPLQMFMGNYFKKLWLE